MNNSDAIFNEVDKRIEDVSRSDFKYSKNLNQWCINYNPPYSMGPHGICFDAEQFDDEEMITDDLIRRILQDAIDKSIKNGFGKIKSAINKESFLKESFKDYCKSKNIL